jgi:hypothetical protein
MPIQSRTALAAATALTLALATPLLASHFGGSALAQTGGGAGSSGGSTGGAGTSGPGATTGGSAVDRGGATDPRGATTTPDGSADRGGESDPMRRSGGPAAPPMSGSSGTDATTRGTFDRGTGGAETGLVGTEKLNAALGALEGESATPRRRGGSARTTQLVRMEEYETAMRNAHALTDPAARSSAIAEARARLQGPSGQAVSSDAIARVDSILGLPASPMAR